MDVDLSRAQWKKSSYSNGGGNCTEVAGFSGVVAVRDSKDASKTTLVFSADEWRRFVQALKDSA